MDHEPFSIESMMNRRQVLKLTGKLFAGLSFGLLSACVSRGSITYNVNIVPSEGQTFYAPAKLGIPLGAKVAWQNLSLYPVTVTCDPGKAIPVTANNEKETIVTYVKLPKGATPFDSGILYPGQMFSHVFDTRGEYMYFSQQNVSPALVGLVSVQ